MNQPPTVTETIRAAHDLTIELSPTGWQLVNGATNPADQPHPLPPLVQASQAGVTCSPAFTRARQLPNDGALAPDDIARVVVGWAPESKNWHLGFLLKGRPETQYKMRWCGLASWPRSQADEHLTSARLAGQSLARILDRPFHLIPAAVEVAVPQGSTQPVASTAPMAPAASPAAPPRPDSVAPRPAPFRFDDWSFEPIPRGYVWQRRARWVIMAGLRWIGYGLMAALFLVMGIGAQLSGTAAVEPGWLPWLGIAVALLLVGSAVQNFWRFVTMTDVVVDTQRREIRRQSRFTTRAVWRIPFERVDYVLLSQTPAQPLSRLPLPGTGSEDDDTTRIVQDVWLHVYAGDEFRPIAHMERVEGRSHRWPLVRQSQKAAGRRRLRLEDFDTPAHHAAQVMAQAAQADVWLDII